MQFSHEILIESTSARNGCLATVDHLKAEVVLNKVKGLFFALWEGVGTATTEQMAEFYEIPVNTVRGVVHKNRDEFESDGLKEIKGSELKALMDIGYCEMQLPDFATRLTIWTPRSALRLGMLLRDSEIAKAVRTALLDASDYASAFVQQSQQNPQPLALRKLELEIEYTKSQTDQINAQNETLRLKIQLQEIAQLPKPSSAPFSSVRRGRPRKNPVSPPLEPPKPIPAPRTHLNRFCEDTGLNYVDGSKLYIKHIWERLEKWYIDNGVLEIDAKTNERTWQDSRPGSEKWVKGMNQVPDRLIVIFPNVKKFRARDGVFFVGLGFADEQPKPFRFLL